MTETSACSKCGQDIVWIKTLAGKSMPCDPKKMIVVTDDGQTISGRISHFATCPYANDLGKEKKMPRNKISARILRIDERPSNQGGNFYYLFFKAKNAGEDVVLKNLFNTPDGLIDADSLPIRIPSEAPAGAPPARKPLQEQMTIDDFIKPKLLTKCKR